VYVDRIPFFDWRFRGSRWAVLPQIRFQMDGTTFDRVQMPFLRESSRRPSYSTRVYSRRRRRHSTTGEKRIIGDGRRGSIWQDGFRYGLYIRFIFNLLRYFSDPRLSQNLSLFPNVIFDRRPMRKPIISHPRVTVTILLRETLAAGKCRPETKNKNYRNL
jgi:hypothetical protein